MKNFLLPFLSLLFSTYAFSQLNSSNKVYQWFTSESKNRLESRIETFKFKAIASKTEGYNKTLSDYSLLLLDEQLLTTNSEYITLTIPINGKHLEIDLKEINISDGSFIVRSSQGVRNDISLGKHYRGIIKGKPQSFATMSIGSNSLSAVIVNENESFNLVKEDISPHYILYESEYLINKEELACATSDYIHQNEIVNSKLDAHSKTDVADVPINLYWEADYDLFQQRGSVQSTIDHMTAMFNVVSTVYFNDDIKLQLSEMFVWDTQDPYDEQGLNGFKNYWNNKNNSFNGDLALSLNSDDNKGAIAFRLENICDRDNAFAFVTIPGQDIWVQSNSSVISHETGHNLGSPHTHACVWFGTNTAIDGCGGTEGSCQRGEILTFGQGTIMSYCNGEKLANGFHPQVKTLIQNRIRSAFCLDDDCPDVGNITFQSQDEIDNFLVMYPNCTKLGNVEFFSDKINNLNGLRNIKSFDYLGIKKTALINLEDLESITSIQFDLDIWENNNLTSLKGLEKLEGNISKLVIYKNPLLTDISSLAGLNSTSQSKTGNNHLTIVNNVKLTSLDGLQNIDFVGNNLTIEDNSQLSNFCALYNVIDKNGLNGTLSIKNNKENPTENDILNNLGCDILGTIENNLDSKFTIVPNPSKDFIHIKTDEKIHSFKIFDVSGKEIKAKLNDKKIDIRNISDGVYILKIKSKSGESHFKFIKS